MVKQTAGRDSLNDFAPKFAELNDDVLFGEVWSREDKLSLKLRSIVTMTALISKGIAKRNCGNHYPCGILCRLAECLGSVPYGKGSVCGES